MAGNALDELIDALITEHQAALLADRRSGVSVPSPTGAELGRARPAPHVDGACARDSAARSRRPGSNARARCPPLLMAASASTAAELLARARTDR